MYKSWKAAGCISVSYSTLLAESMSVFFMNILIL